MFKLVEIMLGKMQYLCYNEFDSVSEVLRKCETMRSYKKSELRRAEILEAAMELFSLNGYQATHMDHIASAVSVARVTLYDYYKSKEDILYALIDQVVEEPRTKPLSGSVRSQLETLAEEIGRAHV